MPNAAASFDADFGPNASARRATTRRARPRPAKRGKERLFSMQRVARYGAVAMSVAVGGGIVVNALMMQRGPHPAPFFATKPDAAAAAPGAAAAASARPATVVDEASKGTPRAERTEALREQPVPRPAAAMPRGGTTAPRADDPIARLIVGAPATAPHRTEAKAADGRTVLAAQQALGKLGFPVKASGSASPATRKAVEAFERSRHLPVNGELSRQVLRALAAESGVRIE